MLKKPKKKIPLTEQRIRELIQEELQKLGSAPNQPPCAPTYPNITPWINPYPDFKPYDQYLPVAYAAGFPMGVYHYAAPMPSVLCPYTWTLSSSNIPTEEK